MAKSSIHGFSLVNIKPPSYGWHKHIKMLPFFCVNEAPFVIQHSKEHFTSCFVAAVAAQKICGKRKSYMLGKKTPRVGRSMYWKCLL